MPAKRFKMQVAAIAVAWIAMNCVAALFLDPTDPDEVARKLAFERMAQPFAARTVTFESSDGDSIATWRYRLFVPEAAAAEEKLPVVLYLHGAGERGDDNARQVRSLPAYLAKDEFQNRHPCWIVAPQCGREDWWSREPESADDFPPDPGSVVMWILDDLLSEQPTADPARVYLVGFSMGGNGVWSLAGRFPEKFAAAVPVAGGGDVSDAHRMAELPIWAVHGADDGVTPPGESREMIDAIREAGGQPHYTELPGVGHGSVGPGLMSSREVLDWMFDQRRPDDD